MHICIFIFIYLRIVKYDIKIKIRNKNDQFLLQAKQIIIDAKNSISSLQTFFSVVLLNIISFLYDVEVSFFVSLAKRLAKRMIGVRSLNFYVKGETQKPTCFKLNNYSII